MVDTVSDTCHPHRECTASDMLVGCLNAYSTDIVTTKYPHPIDGFKKIHRRIIHCLGTQTDKDAMTALIGDASKLHQGGDSSIYSAIVRLSQPFSVGTPLIHCYGNYGNYPKPTSAGHARYLELASSEFTRDIFFNGVHRKSIPMTYSKDFRRMEPLHFIPRVPMALYLNNITIGYGFKSITPQLNFGSICDIVMMYASDRGNSPSVDKLAKHMVPDYPSNQYLVNHIELLEAYRNGVFEHPINLSGNIELGPRTITIRTLPFGVIPNTVAENVISKLQKDKNFWLNGVLKDINDYGGTDNYWEFVIELKNSTDIWAHLDGIKRLFNIDDCIHPIYNFGYNNKIVHLRPTSLLSLWYNSRYKSITAGIKSKQTELQLELLKLSAYLVVCDHTDKVVNICTSSNDEAEIVHRLSTEFEELTRMQSRVLANAKLTTLAKQSRAKLLLDIEKTESELTDVSSTYSRIHDVIYEDAQFLKKKYHTPRKTVPLTNMAGCVHFSKRGVIQYVNSEELMVLLQKFRLSEMTIYHNNPYFPHIFSYQDNKQLPYGSKSRPKEYTADNILRSPSKNPHIGLFIDGGFAITNVVKFGGDNYKLVPLTREFYGVTSMGELEKTSVSEHSFRKSISRGAKTKYIHAIPSNWQSAVILYMNRECKNELRMSLVHNNGGVNHLAIVPNGETVIIDMLPLDSKEVFTSLDPSCTEFMGIKHIHLPDVSSLFKDNNLLVLDLNKQNAGYRIKKHPECSLVGTITAR